jgi:hypothetical protein
VESLRDARPRLACKHVVRNRAPSTICIEHPAAGLLCLQCQITHGRRHSDEVEYRCDSCNELVESIRGGVILDTVDDLRVVDTAGYARALTREVVAVVCLGLCCSCYVALEGGG